MHDDIYEFPKIIELKEQIEEIEEESKIEISKIKALIEKESLENAYLHEILTATDDQLVKAVKKSLEIVEFNSVVDVDEALKSDGSSVPRREDLQIHDTSPTILVEIKGINGLPSDEDALAVWKYIAPRMVEWGRVDVRGLSIINHQRNLPPLKRENISTFRQDILTNAQEQNFGLLTTWDLSRIVRNFVKNDWKHENIQNLFYQNGRIDPVPTHYEYIGFIEDYAEKISVVGIRIEKMELKLNDRISFELPTLFEEQNVESLKHNLKPVECAQEGMLVGIKTHLTKEDAKNGIRVFKIINR